MSTSNLKNIKFLLPVMLATPFLFAGCDGNGGDGNGVDGIESIEPGDQTPALEADLVQLREEEKLARDVYLTLHDTWQLDVFANISNSEQKHMDKIGDLLAAFEIPDPVTDDTVGVFTSPVITGLYNDLVAQGIQSEVDALLVGATIEDLDIFDIREMRTHTDNSVVIDVYDKLECGSNNHMWAFTGQLDGKSTQYTAQYLSDAEIESIVSAGQQSCGNGDGHGGSH